MSELFKKLKAGLEDAIAHKQGKLNLRSETIVLPEPPVVYKPREIKRIRERNKYSQGVFAIVLNVSIKTVQSWESGVRVPSHAALRLLEIIDKGIYNPEIYKRNL
ncbi:MAG: helix-turn-helix domain-containing protein [Candidatus Babeliaceae bacterium]|nr:helix-turn-helix domain-containing protein [Candidatus Babeliaceae bacterium]